MFSRRDRVMRETVKERFAVTPKTGPMFSGLLVDLDESVYHFSDVRLLQGEGSVPADGQLYIERTHVAYLQKVTRTEEG